jgi:hypothetical protein
MKSNHASSEALAQLSSAQARERLKRLQDALRHLADRADELSRTAPGDPLDASRLRLNTALRRLLRK